MHQNKNGVLWRRGKVLDSHAGALSSSPGAVFFFFCSLSTAIFGAQRLKPRGGPRWGLLFSARMDMANDEK